MRKIVDRKTAYRAVLLIFALLAVLSIWPCRLWTEVMETSAGGTRMEEDLEVNPDHIYTQRFVARYDRLNSVDVYISEMEKGSYIDITICDLNEKELVKTAVDTDGMAIPGYVRAPLELNVEVGKEYVLWIRGCRSKFFINLETVPDNSEYIGSMFENGIEIPGMHVAARYNYRLPISKKISVVIIAAIAAFTALLYGLIGFYFSKRPDKNNIITVEKCVKCTANPIAAIFYITLMIMVFPLKIFDIRVADIIFYELGLIVAAGITFYAINHKAVKSEAGISFIDGIDAGEKVRYFFIMLSMAMAIWYGCEYMNGMADIFHTLSERRMVICLAVMIILTFTAKEAFNAINLVWLVVAGGAGVYYYRQNLFPETEKEFDLKNAALKYAVIIAVLGGFVAINLIKLLVNYIQEKLNKNIRVNEERASVSAYGILGYLLFVVLIIMKNNRWWEVALAVTFSCLYIRGLVWKGRKDWLYILSGGLMLNFVISLVYSLLHRCFAGYTSGRFGFLFGTQTVAAEYLTVIGATAAVLLAVKIVSLPQKAGVKILIQTSWKELLLFGWVSSYAIFTVSRTAYLSLFVCVFCILIYYRKKFISILALMIISVVVCFAPAFTLQRMVPAIVGDPVLLEVDDTDPFVRGGAAWGSPNYMCVERFVNLFAGKIFGLDVDTYNYPHDIKNYDPETGLPYCDLYGNPIEEGREESYEEEEEEETTGMAEPANSDNLLASAQFTHAEAVMLLDALNDYVDESNKWDVISNGRITIYKTYLSELNMIGHDVQPALPNGEIALHAHNAYLQVAYDSGIPAGVLFAAFIIGGFGCGIIFCKRNEKVQPLALVPFAIIVGFMVAGVSEWVFQFSNPTTLALMLSIFPLMQNNKSR